jgi:hypothetical protein
MIYISEHLKSREKMIDKFPESVIEKLRYYVYRLIDPRNGETFYVGKGNKNRVFDHLAQEADSDDDALTEKIERIRQIKSSGLDVLHIIHRHGMDEETAFAVEAALIEAYPGLTNLAGGHGNQDFGVMHATEIINMYEAQDADLSLHKIIMINVNDAEQRSLYNSTRLAWRMSKEKAEKAEYVLAVSKGLIRGVFKPTRWMDATPEHFPGIEPMPGRIGFEGEIAEPHICEIYLRKKVPDEYRKRGAANPIKYSY